MFRFRPPLMMPNVAAHGPSSGCTGSALSLRLMAQMTSESAATASLPFSGVLAWQATPFASSRNQVLPLWATLMAPFVGSASST